MSEYLSSEAIILKSRDYREDDKLITFFGAKSGKMSALVKGAKKSGSKLRGAVQIFSVTDLTLAQGKTMPIVIGAEPIKSFNGLAEDYLRINYASILSEFVDKVMPEKAADEEVYNAFKTGIRTIADANPWSGCIGAIFRLLEHLGYGAEYRACTFCGRNLNEEKKVYAHLDGLVCSVCAAEAGEECRELSRESTTILNALENFEAEKFGQIYASSRAKKEIEDYLELQLGNILDYPLKSWEIHKNIAKTT